MWIRGVFMIYKKILTIFILSIVTISCVNSGQSRGNGQYTPTNETENNLSMTQQPVDTTESVQITFIESSEDGKEAMYATNLDCILKNTLCNDDPVLIFDNVTTPRNTNGTTMIFSTYSWSIHGNQLSMSFGGDIFLGYYNESSDVFEWKNITNSRDVIDSDPVWGLSDNIYYLSCSFELYNGCRLKRYDLNENLSAQLWEGLIDDSIDSFAVSPDENNVVVDFSKNDEFGYSQLYRISIDGRDVQQITYGKYNYTSPSFSLSDSKITFIRSSAVDGVVSEVDIIVMDLDSGDEKNVTGKFSGEPFAPNFLPTNTQIIFYSFNPDLSSNVFIASLDEENIIQITNGENQNTKPNWRYFLGKLRN